VTWIRWNPYPTGPITAEVTRSTNGGTSFSFVTSPMTGQVNPRDSSATSSCGRPALKGNIRYLPSPQIAVSPNGNVHIVYSYDADGFGTGDVVNVYYRRSTDNGATWGPEVKLNDDATSNDQYQPTLSIGPSGRVVTGWYDRRNDGGNTLFEYYMRVSDDGGGTWAPSTLVSDVPSPIYLDPNLATCYHGDYDTQVQDGASAYVQWSDDRNIVSSHNDPDVWMERTVFAPGFSISADITKGQVCAGDMATFNLSVLSLGGYTGRVRLVANGIMTPNRGHAPFSSTFEADTTGMPAGTFWARVKATGQAPADPARQRIRVPFNVYDASAGGTTLVSPPDAATGVSTQAVLTWAADASATSYWVEVATDAGFTNVIYSDETDDTTVTVGLGPNTQYFWRVMSHNPCGSSAWSSVWSFTTVNELCSSPNLAIIDNATVSDSMTFSTGDNVGDLNVYLDVSHTWVGDLQFTLEHDDTATTSMIINRPGNPATTFGCQEDNYDVTVDDEGGDPAIEGQCSASPPAISGDAPGGDPAGNTLNVFDGEAFTGTWTLSVTDNAGGDTGTVNQWCLINTP
jgi:hypothetical protein